MYKAYLNGNLFFDTQANLDELALTSATLNFQLGGAGTFNFTALDSNIAYNNFDSPKSYIDVYRNDSLIWSGRVITPTQDLYKQKAVTCEGIFAVLNDSVYRAPIEPFTGTLAELVELLITSHNEQVEEEKQIQIRNITVTDEYLYRAYENVESTMKRLQDLVSSYGGYMSVEKVGGALYFDWLAEINTVSQQTVTVTSITSINKSTSIQDVITILIPLGAEQELEDGTKRRLTIESVNNGVDYLESQTGIATYGRIVGVEIWDDVNVPALLKSKGQDYLNKKAQTAYSFSITAIDLADIGEAGASENFKVGTRLRVQVPHLDIDGYYTTTTQSLNLLQPASNSITVGVVGTTGVGFISKNANVESHTQSQIQRIASEYAPNTRLVDVQNQLIETNASVENVSGTIRSVASALELTNGNVSALQTIVQQDATQIQAVVEQNNQIALVFRITANGVEIGKQDDPVYSRQTNNAYQFVDSSGNKVLLEINTLGIQAPTATVEEQVAFLAGSTPQWAIRKGEVDGNGHYNLNDIWIGG